MEIIMVNQHLQEYNTNLVGKNKLLLTSEVQLRERVIVSQAFSQCARSFITNTIPCTVNPFYEKVNLHHESIYNVMMIKNAN
jgi:hypothetical protein